MCTYLRADFFLLTVAYRWGSEVKKLLMQYVNAPLQVSWISKWTSSNGRSKRCRLQSTTKFNCLRYQLPMTFAITTRTGSVAIAALCGWVTEMRKIHLPSQLALKQLLRRKVLERVSFYVRGRQSSGKCVPILGSKPCSVPTTSVFLYRSRIPFVNYYKINM